MKTITDAEILGKYARHLLQLDDAAGGDPLSLGRALLVEAVLEFQNELRRKRQETEVRR